MRVSWERLGEAPVREAQYLALDVFEGNTAVPEESIYENSDRHNVITEDSQTHQEQEMERVYINAIPQIILESEANRMSK